MRVVTVGVALHLMSACRRHPACLCTRRQMRTLARVVALASSTAARLPSRRRTSWGARVHVAERTSMRRSPRR